jgi:hypothetical protein
MARTTDLLALIRADWRRLIKWLLGGWAVFALVLLLALVDLGCRGCPPGTVAAFTGIKVQLFSLVYAMAPWVFSVHVVHHGTEVLLGLPLSHRDINRFEFLRGIVLGVLCLPMWGLVLWILPRYGFMVHPWLVVFTALGLLAYQLFGMVVGLFWRVAVTAVFPFLVFPPHTHRLLGGPLEFATTPWAPTFLALALLGFMPWVLAKRYSGTERKN